jgi:hypothetical protein
VAPALSLAAAGFSATLPKVSPAVCSSVGGGGAGKDVAGIRFWLRHAWELTAAPDSSRFQISQEEP